MAGVAEVWPVHGLALRTTDMELRVMTEADLGPICRALPDDVELDPAATRYPGLDERSGRSAIVAQGYWRALGTWSPESWALPFVVRGSGGVVLGVQWLEHSSPHLLAETGSAGLEDEPG